MVLGTNNEGAALVGGSLLTTGGRMKTLKIVGVGKAVYVQTGKGSVLLLPGEVMDAPENEAKIVIGFRRARLFDPIVDAPADPPPTVIEPDPAVESQPARGRRTKKTRED